MIDTVAKRASALGLYVRASDASAEAVWDYLVSNLGATTTVGGYFKALLDAILAKTSTIGTGSGTVVTAVPSATQLTLVQGDDYLAVDGRALDFTYSGYPDFTGASSVKLRITPINSPGILKLTLTGSVLSSTSLRFEATRTQTATLDQNQMQFEVEVTLADGSVVTPTPLNFGKVTVYPQASTT